LAFNNVTINEGPLPSYAQARASENLHKRQQAVVLCKRSDQVACEQGFGPPVPLSTGWVSPDLAPQVCLPSIPRARGGQPLPTAPAVEGAPAPRKLEEAMPPQKK